MFVLGSYDPSLVVLAKSRRDIAFENASVARFKPILTETR